MTTALFFKPRGAAPYAAPGARAGTAAVVPPPPVTTAPAPQATVSPAPSYTVSGTPETKLLEQTSLVGGR